MSLFTSFCQMGFRKIVSHLPLSQGSIPIFTKMIEFRLFGGLPVQQSTRRMLAHFTRASSLIQSKDPIILSKTFFPQQRQSLLFASRLKPRSYSPFSTKRSEGLEAGGDIIVIQGNHNRADIKKSWAVKIPGVGLVVIPLGIAVGAACTTCYLKPEYDICATIYDIYSTFAEKIGIKKK